MSFPYEGKVPRHGGGEGFNQRMTQIFNRTQQTELRRQLRHTMTKSETVLWKYIRNSQLGYKFRRQCGVGRYIVDFYCPKLKLVVEVDGYTHIDEDAYDNDMKRERHLRNLGLTVKRYSSDQVFKQIREVYQDLLNTCEELDGGGLVLTTPPLRGTPPS